LGSAYLYGHGNWSWSELGYSALVGAATGALGGAMSGAQGPAATGGESVADTGAAPGPGGGVSCGGGAPTAMLGTVATPFDGASAMRMSDWLGPQGASDVVFSAPWDPPSASDIPMPVPGVPDVDPVAKVPAGRIPVNQRIDPGTDNLVAVNRFGEPPVGKQRVFYLAPDALDALHALRADAKAEGFDREMFSLTSAYRSQARQNVLHSGATGKYGSGAGKWVASKSEHITGRAFDLNLGISNSSENAKSGAFNHLREYEWLSAHAGQYGLNPYGAEPWHWSHNVVGY
jgi:hypothetical protein